MMKKIFTLLVLGCFCVISVAQNLIPRDIPTPTASDFGKFGDIPVSYYTGQPNITIPLYNLSVKGLKMPIYLQYDAKGVLVNSAPGWVGCNWSLIAGGCITRSQNALPDEYVPTKKNSINPYVDYFHSYNKILEDQNDLETMNDNIYWSRCDYMPDEFSFNFMGKSGTFILGNDGQWKVISDDNIDVIFDINDNDNYIYPFIDHFLKDKNCSQFSKVPKCIKGFTLRDGEGYEYIFGGDNSSIDYSVDFFSQNENDDRHSFSANCWYLTQIKDKYGNLLYTLKYERGKYLAQFSNCYSCSYYQTQNFVHGFFRTLFKLKNQSGETFTNNAQFPYSGTLNSPVYLKEIILADNNSSKGYNVAFNSEYSKIFTTDHYPKLSLTDYYRERIDMGDDFAYLTENGKSDDGVSYAYDRKLDGRYSTHNFDILNATRNKELKSITFKNGPYEEKVIELKYNNTPRMHLTEVISYSPNNPYSSEGRDSANIYKLTYHNFEAFPKDYLSLAADHYGYYNGHNENKITKCNKECNANSLTGILEKITYPTGGYTKFQFEQNDYGKYRSEDRYRMIDECGKTGGLRIKRIENHLGVDWRVDVPVQTWDFEYTIPGTNISSGQLFAKPRYYFKNLTVDYWDKEYATTHSLFRNSSIIPLCNSFGPHVGYSYVTVKERNGKIERYHFSNIDSSKSILGNFGGGLPSFDERFTEQDYNRGKLLSKEIFDKNNNILNKVAYRYTLSPIYDKVRASCIVIKDSDPGPFYSAGNIFDYLIYKYDIEGDTTINYYGNNKVVDINNYSKTNNFFTTSSPYTHKFVGRTLLSKTSVRGENTVKTEYLYPSSNDHSTPEGRNFNENYILNPNGQRNYYNGVFLGGTKTLYRFDEKGVIVADKEVKTNPDHSELITTNYISYRDNYNIEKYKPYNGPLTYVGFDDWGNRPTSCTFYEDPNDKKARTGRTPIYYYDPINGLFSIEYPNDRTLDFVYDSFSRLEHTEETIINIPGDWTRNILNRYKYHFKKTEE